MNDKPASQASVFSIWLLRLYAFVLGLIGAAMLCGGVWLVYLGGSFYYATAGTLIVASAILLFTRRRVGAWLYGFTLAFTIAWAIYEVGFDAWALLPRLLLLSAFGLWLLLPWSQRPLNGGFASLARGPFGASGVIAGSAMTSVALGSLLFTFLTELPADPRLQTGFGGFPPPSHMTFHGEAGTDWPYFGGEPGGSRYSPLNEITPDNLPQLKLAWEVDVGQIPATNATPIKIGDRIYTCNNNNEVFALNAATGTQRWHVDASEGFGGVCRGVAYFKAPGSEGPCAARILSGTNMGKLIALDAETGQPCPGFGTGGTVDLNKGIGDFEGKVVPGYYRVTSAPTIVRGKIVVGGWVTDGQYWGETSGVIRAYDAVTGAFSWAWDMGNPDDHREPAPGKTYTTATPNSWAPMSADDELGLVYLPTGNATPDFYGPQRRSFDDAFSTSVVALNADTGKLVWSFQTVHHDIWDYDVASQPTLVDLPQKDGTLRKALVQATKQGELYVLDRITGKPVFDVTETPVPQAGAVPEERLSPTQPFSNKLPSFRGANLRGADMWGISPLDQLYCRVKFAQARYEGPFTPPGLTPSIIFPSTFGAINWGSVTIDPDHGVMVVNHNRFASYIQLLDRKTADAAGAKIQPAFGKAKEVGSLVPQQRTPYGAYPQFWLTALGVPCIAPPYGLISAVDLNTGKLLWTNRFGTAKGMGPLGIGFPFAVPMGTPTHGGSIVTASGLVFIGASPDNFFHIYDLRSGNLLWRYELPGGGGTPITYTVDGRQYIALSAGGQGAIGSRFSKKMVAFTLSE
jgi:quinoprotein glucose dehydrogenase